MKKMLLSMCFLLIFSSYVYADCTVESYTRRKANNTVFLTREEGNIFLNCREYDPETGRQINIIKKEVTIVDLGYLRQSYVSLRDNIILLIQDIQNLP